MTRQASVTIVNAGARNVRSQPIAEYVAASTAIDLCAREYRVRPICEDDCRCRFAQDDLRFAEGDRRPCQATNSEWNINAAELRCASPQIVGGLSARLAQHFRPLLAPLATTSSREEATKRHDIAWLMPRMLPKPARSP
ncbi:hypothetical protein MRB53_041806 [Persea americana]|nr:hypothetical protein MRB53_041806 [Persea americana]